MMRFLLTLMIALVAASPGVAQPTMQDPVQISDIGRTPPNGPCQYPCNRVAVIFIHGITGDSTTWSNGTVEWPKLLADDSDLQTELGTALDVYRVDYFSQLNEGPSVTTINKNLSAKLDEKLFGRPLGGRGYSKIVLVCHSLGGILCRNYLLHVKLRWGHAFLSLFRATITLGTPLEGSDLANLTLVRASSNEQVRVLRPIDFNDFLQLLHESTQEFTQKRQTLGCPEVQFYAGYEMRDTPLVEGIPFPTLRIVSQQSATAGVQHTKGFDKNHRELVKPANRSDAVYDWVRGILRTCGPNGGACSAAIDRTCGRPSWLSTP